MDNAIEVKKVRKSFKQHIAINGISVSFEKRKIHGIVGRNGSGKTVLLKCICGLMHHDEGEIIVNGKRIGKDIDIAENIGAIIEVPGFLPNYNGLANLRMLMGISRRTDRERIEECIQIVGLNPWDKKHVGKYSLGMKQRLGIAQAIMEDPEILLLDEPMNGLDNQGVIEMRELFLQLRSQGKTILLSSHNREDINVLCDKVYEMDKGSLLKRQ